MGYFINCIKKEDALTREVKELIPNMNLRRRMSKVVKMGVATALDACLDFEEYGNIDAIITATWLGCMTDSEKFLRSMIEADGQLLNPTPFIQSTFNTVGGQVALIKGLHGYNNTFTHANCSFESALLDATLQLDFGNANAVLLGVFDEITPAVTDLYSRISDAKNDSMKEGALFFILTKEKYPCSVAEIISFDYDNLNDDNYIFASQLVKENWSGQLAEILWNCVQNNRKEELKLKVETVDCHCFKLQFKCL